MNSTEQSENSIEISENLDDEIEALNKNINHILVYDLLIPNISSATEKEFQDALLISLKEFLAKKYIEIREDIIKNDIKVLNIIGKDFCFSNLHLIYEKSLLETNFPYYANKLRTDYVKDDEDILCFGDQYHGSRAFNYLEMLTSKNIPAISYGIRYSFGNYKQKLVQGSMVNDPININFCDPYEIKRPELMVKVRFGGKLGKIAGKITWINYEEVEVLPSDILIPGFNNSFVNIIRLWSAWHRNRHPLEYKNELEYMKIVCDDCEHDDLTKTSIPYSYNYYEDDFINEYSMRQSYLLASATVADIIRDYNKNNNDLLFDSSKFIKKVSLHITCDSCIIIILELIRVLIDEYNCNYDEALIIIKNICTYTINAQSLKNMVFWPIYFLKKNFPHHWLLVRQFDVYFNKSKNSSILGDTNFEESHIILNGQVNMCLIAIIACQKSHSLFASHFITLSEIMFPNQYNRDHIIINKSLYGISYFLDVISQNKYLFKEINKELNIYNEQSAITPYDFSTYSMFLNNLVNSDNACDILRNIKKLNKEECLKLLKEKYLFNANVNDDWIFINTFLPIIEENCHILLIMQMLFIYFNILEKKATYKPMFFIIMGNATPGDLYGKEMINLILHVCQVINNNEITEKYLQVLFINSNSLQILSRIMVATDIYENFANIYFPIFNNDIFSFMMNGALFIATPNGVINDLVAISNNEYGYILQYHSTNENKKEKKKLRKITNLRYLYPLIDSKFVPFVTDLFNEHALYMLETYDEIIRIQSLAFAQFEDSQNWYFCVLKSMKCASKFTLETTLDNYDLQAPRIH